jgi:hypothetical protein
MAQAVGPGTSLSNKVAPTISLPLVKVLVIPASLSLKDLFKMIYMIRIIVEDLDSSSHTAESKAMVSRAIIK